MTMVTSPVEQLVAETRDTLALYEPDTMTFNVPFGDEGIEVVDTQILRFSTYDVGTVIISGNVTVDWIGAKDPSVKERFYIDFVRDNEPHLLVLEPEAAKASMIYDIETMDEAEPDSEDILRALYLLGLAREVKADTDERVGTMVDIVNKYADIDSLEFTEDDNPEVVAKKEKTIRVYDDDDCRAIEMTVLLETGFEDGEIKNWHVAYFDVELENNPVLTLQLNLDTRRLFTAPDEEADDEGDDVTYEQTYLEELESIVAAVDKFAT